MPASVAWVVKVSLQHIEPLIWRRIIISPKKTLYELHELIQSFGWYDQHAWAFRNPTTNACLGEPPKRRAGRSRAAGGSPSPDARAVMLFDCMERIGDGILYEYDFGDVWSHEIELEGLLVLPDPFETALLDGEHPFPLEDCGGPAGYARLQACWRDNKDPFGNEEHAEWAAEIVRPVFELAALKQRFSPLSAANQAELDQTSVQLPGVPKHRVKVLTTDLIRELQLRVRNTLAEFDRDHGMHSSFSAMSYTADNGHMTVETAVIRNDGIVMDREATAYVERAAEFGLSPSWLGEVILLGKDRVRIIGLKPRSKKSVLLESLPEPGKPSQRFQMHPEQLPAYFGPV